MKIDTIKDMKRFIMKLIDESNEFIVYQDEVDEIAGTFSCDGETTDESFHILVTKKERYER